MSIIARITGIGHYLPERIVSNQELTQTIETTDEWIRERTGITQRHIAAEGQVTSDLAAEAAKKALARAGKAAAEVELVIVATTTPDETFPATATRVQQKIGAGGAAFDVAAACSGFVYGITLANSLIQTGQVKTALVIGAETYSRIVDWDDRGTCILFGDGAGAVVLEAADAAGKTGVLSSVIYSDGGLGDLLKTTGGPSLNQITGTVLMNGREVFRHAVAKMSEALASALEKAGVTLGEVDWLIPHQANARILSTMAEKLPFPAEKVVMTLDRHANTSAASIPLALSVAQDEGRLKAGNLLACPALGAGLTWGCCIIRL